MSIFVQALILFGICGNDSAVASITGSMSGDAVPSAYSVINVDIDTIDGPVVVPPSIMGYIHNIRDEAHAADEEILNALSRLMKRTGSLVQSVINRSKLIKRNLIPSSFLSGPPSLAREPNYGPFPQYNILFEDEPISDFYDSKIRNTPSHYKSGTTSGLLQMLQKSKSLYERLRTAIQDPATAQKNKGFMSSAKDAMINTMPSSFYEDHEQFIEKNIVPFQEITIHEESAVPEGGSAPVMPPDLSQLLDLNRTMDKMAFKLLETEERVLLKQVDKILRSR
jgi:hypothetical protein